MAAVEVRGGEVGSNERWLAFWAKVPRTITARAGSFALACIVLGSFIYRLHVARVCSLWIDEVGTHLDSLKPWSVVLVAPTREHPPLLYILVKAAISVLGTSEVGLRAVSLLFGCVLLVAAYELCLELGLTVGRALLVVATLALSPFFIRHATEARQYAIFSALVTLATTRALRLLRGQVQAGNLVGLVVCASAAAYTQYFGLAYGVALLAAVGVGIAPAWKQSTWPRRVALVGTLSLLLGLLGFVAARAAAVADHYSMGKSDATEAHSFDWGLVRDLTDQFSFLTNHTWSLWIEPCLALVGLLLISWRARGVARLLPLGLGLLPCAAVLFVSATHFMAPRYVAPSALWYHLGACVALFASIDRLRLLVPPVGRLARIPQFVALLVLAGPLVGRLREYPDGFGAGADDYRGLQHYFLSNLAGDTALVAYYGFFGELLFGKEYPIGSKPIRLERFRPVPGVARYLVVGIHMDDERNRDFEKLVTKKFGISAEEWRSLQVISMPHSIYQPAVTARITPFRGDPAPAPAKKHRRKRKTR